MRVFILSTISLVLFAACSPIHTVTPIPPIIAPATILPGTSSPATAAPSQAPQQPTQAGGAAIPAGPVSLQVTSPQDGAVSNASQIQVAGVTSPGAVVTVNDDVMLAGPDGRFQSNVTLSEGPNLIEVIASNSSGVETTVQLTVTYEP